MKRIFKIIGLILLFSLVSYPGMGAEAEEGAVRVMELVNTPTARLYPRGEYGISLKIYDEGSLLFRFVLSLTDYVMLGVPLDIRHFIGKRAMEVELPPVIWAKIRLTKKGGGWPMAIGYDPIDYGEEGDKRVRGLYLACTKPIRLGNLHVEWHFGANADLREFEHRGVCVFGGMDLSINPYLLFYSEVDGISFKSGKSSVLSLGIRYLSLERFEADIGLRFVGDTTDRFVSFRYSHPLF
ncbi:TPA: hypothetical protein DCX15_02035 [bacterium]|nr:hypothetical protein [bacterium]